MISFRVWSILKVIRQLRVTVKLQVPRRSPVSTCAFHAGTPKSSAASSMAVRKVTIVRTFLITDAGSCEASSRSMKRRNPLWTTLRIFKGNRIRTKVGCQVTLYSLTPRHGMLQCPSTRRSPVLVGSVLTGPASKAGVFAVARFSLKRHIRYHVKKMTWVVGTVIPFGYAAGFADIRVTFPDGKESDCLQKIYQVGPHVGAAFAGSVRIGFSMLFRLNQLLLQDVNPGYGWDVTAVAEWWPDDARAIWNIAPSNEKNLGCELMLFGVHPSDGQPWPKAHLYTFRPPSFEAAPVSPWGIGSIGKGARIKTYCEPLGDLWELVQLEAGHPGGIAAGIESRLSDSLQVLPIPGISPHLHVCIAFRDRLVMRTNDRRYIGHPPSTHSVMPHVATSYSGFLKLCGGSAAAEGAVA
jgi:hypothetical protein